MIEADAATAHLVPSEGGLRGSTAQYVSRISILHADPGIQSPKEPIWLMGATAGLSGLSQREDMKYPGNYMGKRGRNMGACDHISPYMYIEFSVKRRQKSSQWRRSKKWRAWVLVVWGKVATSAWHYQLKMMKARCISHICFELSHTVPVYTCVNKEGITILILRISSGFFGVFFPVF